MRHISRLFISAGILLFLLTSFAYSQTLADAARDAQAKKKTQTATGHVYTNESAEFHSAPASAASAKSSDTDSDASNADAAKDSATSADAAPLSDEDKKKAADEFKDKIAKQQANIDLLKRELDVLQREDRMRAAVFYSDAGARLRDPGKYTQDEQKYKDDIAAKQKAIADAQAVLDKLRDDARRAGVNVS